MTDNDIARLIMSSNPQKSSTATQLLLKNWPYGSLFIC